VQHRGDVGAGGSVFGRRRGRGLVFLGHTEKSDVILERDESESI
jgi:hypothetical protein